MDVYLDGTTDGLDPTVALHATDVLHDTWNGWVRPLATAEAFGAFLDAWRANDPNGIWGYVTEAGGYLVLSSTDSEVPADQFPVAGALPDGTSVYDLTGWAWVVFNSDDSD